MRFSLIGFVVIVPAIGRGTVMEQIRFESSNLLKHGIRVYYQVPEWGEAGKRADFYY